MNRYHITITEYTDADKPELTSSEEILSFRTDNKPDIPALVSMLSRPPRQRRKDAGTTRQPGLKLQ